jgi:hypothetical protein
MAGIPGAAGPGAPYPQWLYNTVTHTVSEVSGPAAKTAAEVVSWPAKLIFFTSQQAADAYMAAQGGGADISRSPLTKAANTATSAATGGLTGLAAIGDFFSRLTQASTWLRIGEGILGLLLIAVGTARMTHAVPAAAQIAKAVK